MGRGAMYIVLAWLAVSLVTAPLIGLLLRRLGASDRPPLGDAGPSAGREAAMWDLPERSGSVVLHGVSGTAGSAEVVAPSPGTRVVERMSSSRLPTRPAAAASSARFAASPSRRAIEEVIRDGAFAVSFQPIVDLRDRLPVGSEALTRFTDGVRPDARFDDAVAVGLGTQLEVATMRAALSHADSLPSHGYIALNVTPQLLYERDELAALIDDLRCDVVIELCERYPVESYDALLASFEQFGPHVRLAVDDVGSGYASLRHILRLRPSIVKIDQSAVRNVDTASDERAMVAAVCNLAASIGATVVAEGVEHERQVDTLIGLGVQYGQGWLLGRPRPVAVSLGLGGAATS